MAGGKFRKITFGSGTYTVDDEIKFMEITDAIVGHGMIFVPETVKPGGHIVVGAECTSESNIVAIPLKASNAKWAVKLLNATQDPMQNVSTGGTYTIRIAYVAYVAPA